jgi:NAD(P)-dependent dehydrogenase (short-subunit alcohol dehydrogenase family)
MELGLKDKIALVTGSSRGIGRGIALALAAEGCHIMLTGRDAAALDEVANTIRGKGRRAAISVGDLRELAGAAALIETVQREFGRQHQARRLFRAYRRRLGRRLCAEILRPYAARARGLAAPPSAARLGGRDRRHRRPQAHCRVHDRQFGERGGRSL